ncbi:ABC-2 family transporter protein [Rubripirellula obstinata]|uniref:ABC-2 family transporter protein n=1 Tax=Rubripirellula obstinata TaxID=406547 RepID=A0A5B1CQ78_9BACT|nr:ABC transporter permease [Rubripirellula obstinata]KAA1261374.1 ABC-2 family transporter protein [Rubripirellula obstinata]
MNAIPREMRAFLWRDARQLIPLVAMLVVVTTLILTLWLFTDDNFDGYVPSVWIPLILPTLLAAGCGAILVGNEKETRTLKWIASLPVQPARVFQSKLLVATVALIAMWLAALLLLVGMSVAGSDSIRDVASLTKTSIPWNVSFWVVHTIFILVAGMYAAWRIENAFGSLVAMIPIAGVPISLATISYKCYLIASGHYYDQESATALATLFTLPAIALMVWLGYRAAIRFFAADPPPRVASSANESQQGLFSWIDPWKPPASGIPSAKPFRISLATLLWQAFHQNRLAFIGLSACVLLGMICLALTATQRSYNLVGDSLNLFWVAGFFALSWLGVLSFCGDGSAKSLKFLADRGVSPSTVWLGRHLMPIAIVSAALLVYGLSQRSILAGGYLRAGPMFSMAVITAVMLVIYGVSQWTSMMIRVLGGSVFLAPLLSVVCIGWLIAQWTWIGSPVWVMVICIALPYAVTLMLMKRHMDDRRDLRFWLINFAAIAVGIVGLPIAQCAYQISQFPTISESRRAELQSMAMKFGTDSASPFAIMRVDWNENDYLSKTWDGKPTGQQIAKRLDAIQDRPQDWLEIPSRASQPLQFDTSVLEASIGSAEYYRLRMVDDPSEAAMEQFEAWCEFLIEYGQRMRLSSRLWDQDGADEVAIWLTHTFAKTEMQQFWDRPTTREAMQFISAADDRNEARRRAVLESWTEYHDNIESDSPSRSDFGGYYSLLDFQSTPDFQRPYLVDRRMDVIASVAIEMIDAAENGASTMPMRQLLHQVLFDNELAFDSGPYSDRSAISAMSPNFSGNPNQARVPAVKWYGPWEQDAITLYRSWQKAESTQRQSTVPEVK